LQRGDSERGDAVRSQSMKFQLLRRPDRLAPALRPEHWKSQSEENAYRRGGRDHPL